MPKEPKNLDATIQDLQALQGRWEQLAVEADGILNPPDEYTGPGVVTIFSKNHFLVCTPDGTSLLEGIFTLDASATPKTIDYVDSMGPDKGKRLLAIYSLKGDHFQFIAASAGAARPSSFRTEQGQTMRSFVRKISVD